MTDSANPIERSQRSSRRFQLRIREISLLLFALLVWCCGQAVQAQTAYAPGGLFIHPTAYTARAHQFSTYAAAFTQDQSQGTNNSFYPLSFTFSPTDRLQVSALAVYHQAANDPSHTHLGTFIKYQLLPDSAAHPAFAITGAYAGNDHLESSITGVVSHRFMHNGRVLTTAHLGVKSGRTGHEDGERDDFGGFVGLQVPLNREWNLVGETSTRLKFDRSSATSIGLMYQPRHGIGLSLAMVNGGRSSRMKPFFGVAFPLGR